VWRNFFAFGNCAVDRIFILAGRENEVNITVRSMPQAIESQRNKGCVLVGSHFGSFESMRVVGARRGLPFSILLDRQIGRMLTSLFESLNPGFAADIIDASQRGPDLVLSLKEAIQRDRKVGMTADRVRAGERSVTVDFLGSPAQFPVSPWILAGVLRVPVFIGFGVYTGGNRYDCHFELFADRIELPRQDRDAALQRYAQAYARRLEHYARLAPYNWFNFYDFWH
jgi:predicted LPLAT superfamily acyltransferase